MTTTHPRKSPSSGPAPELVPAGQDVVTELEALEEGPPGIADEVFLLVRSDGGDWGRTEA